MNTKYGKINFWLDHASTKCSWFSVVFAISLCTTKHFCKIYSVNPISTSFLKDPWCFDIPIALKPTFHNMDADFHHINISDMICSNNYDFNCFNFIFGNQFNSSSGSLGTINFDSNNCWVWQLKSNCSKIFATVYHHLNLNSSLSDNWIGWKILWHLHVAPHLKHFIGFVLKAVYLLLNFFIICIWARIIPTFSVASLGKLLIIYLVNVPKLFWSGRRSAAM